MLIDWFTVGAQALNFLILVWLMRRFLYKPIRQAIDEREKRIASELADADAKKAEAKGERDEFQRKNEELDQQRGALLGKATEEAKAEGQRLIEEARKAADILSAKRQEALRNEARNLNEAIGRRAQSEVFAIARKTLTDLGGRSLEARIAEVFIRRVREMDGPAKGGLAEALRTASEPALVRSAFDLPAEQRAAIQAALRETFSAAVRVRFESAPDLIGGIELTTQGQKVAWSIADYLGSLEKGVEDLLKAHEEPGPKAKAAADVTTKIARRAYELYEERGQRSNSAGQDWSQAEREVREGAGEPKPTLETEVKPDTTVKLAPDAAAGPKPDAKADPKLEAKPPPKGEAAVGTKSEERQPPTKSA